MATWTTTLGADPATSVYQVGSPSTTLAGVGAIPTGDTWDAQGNTYDTVGFVVSNGVTITSSTGRGTLNNPGVVITAQAVTIGPGPYPTPTSYLTIAPSQAGLFSNVVGGNVWEIYGAGIHAPVYISSIVTNGDGSLTVNLQGSGHGAMRTGFTAGVNYRFFIPFSPIIEVLSNTAPVTIANLNLTGTNNPINFIDVGAVVNGAGISLKAASYVDIDNVTTQYTWGDGFETSVLAGSPTLNTNITVTNLNCSSPGREAVTLVAIDTASFTSCTFTAGLQDAISYESDLAGIGAANLTFNSCAFNGPINGIAPVNGPIIYNYCTNYATLSPPTGNGKFTLHDAISTYQVTLNYCTWVFPSTQGSSANIDQKGGICRWNNCTLLQAVPGSTNVNPNYSAVQIAPITSQGRVWSHAYTDIANEFTGTQNLQLNTYGSLPASGAGVTVQIGVTRDDGVTGTAIFHYVSVTGTNNANTYLVDVTFVSVTYNGTTQSAASVRSAGDKWSLAYEASVYWVQPHTGALLILSNSPFPHPLPKQLANTVDSLSEVEFLGNAIWSPGPTPYGGEPYGAGPYGGDYPFSAPPPYYPLGGTVIFQTPCVQDEPPYLPDSTPQQFALYRHMANRWRGVNVWQRSDGTFCQDTPTPYESSQTALACFFSKGPMGPDETAEQQLDSNVNYPWQPFPGSAAFGQTVSPGAFVYVQNWDGTNQTEIQDPFLAAWWQPGAYNVVTQEEALELTAAGYGDCLS